MTEIIEVVDGNHRKKVQTAVWQRSGLIDPKEPVLSVRRQCELLNVHRSCVYYRSKCQLKWGRFSRRQYLLPQEEPMVSVPYIIGTQILILLAGGNMNPNIDT